MFQKKAVFGDALLSKTYSFTYGNVIEKFMIKNETAIKLFDPQL